MTNYIEYETKEPTRWDSLANKYYGNCFNIQPIIKANPTIPITAFIEEGTKVYIPILEDDTTSKINKELPVWKQ